MELPGLTNQPMEVLNKESEKSFQKYSSSRLSKSSSTTVWWEVQETANVLLLHRCHCLPPHRLRHHLHLPLQPRHHRPHHLLVARGKPSHPTDQTLLLTQ